MVTVHPAARGNPEIYYKEIWHVALRIYSNNVTKLNFMSKLITPEQLYNILTRDIDVITNMTYDQIGLDIEDGKLVAHTTPRLIHRIFPVIESLQAYLNTGSLGSNKFYRSRIKNIETYEDVIAEYIFRTRDINQSVIKLNLPDLEDNIKLNSDRIVKLIKQKKIPVLIEFKDSITIEEDNPYRPGTKVKLLTPVELEAFYLSLKEIS